MSARPLALLAGPVAVAALLTGCGTTTLDTSSIEQEIRSSLTRQSGGAWTVDCPDDVTPEAGGRFTCTVSGDDGVTFEVLAIQSDDQGHVALDFSNGGGSGGMGGDVVDPSSSTPS
jgi:hypothetical protein